MEPDFELCQVVGESADRLVSAQVFMSGGGADITSRNITKELYEAARALQGAPLSSLAARELVERVQPRDVVLICAGFFDPPAMISEADGPVGAALLGRALAVALDATPVFLTEVTNLARMEALVRATGLDVIGLDMAVTTPFKAAILPLPIGRSRAAVEAPRCFDRTGAKAMVCIEKPAPNFTGTTHTGPGLDVTDVVGKVELYIDEAKRRGVLTIGIGDGGNEVGMGRIPEAVREVVPTGKLIGTCVETDILVVATIANWGSYAIEACLAAALHLPEALHSRDVERRVADAAARAGFIDPTSGMAHGWVDGTPPIAGESILELLRCMVELRLDRKRRPHGMSGFGRRWQETGRAEATVALWARHLAAEEAEFFSRAERGG
ncbi:glutamate cyclase domain-containing protein [Falsiroseomonas sp.]|uniref:glutamate cyclase domain-containing protein n=1 Tax=Falsiroseomonas sp. TaxID=2870721 RepID=UPI003F7179B9